MKFLQKLGLSFFVAALLLFIAINVYGPFQLTPRSLSTGNAYHDQEILDAARKSNMLDQSFPSGISFSASLKKVMKEAQRELDQKAQTALPEGVQEWDYRLGDWKIKEYMLATVKHSHTGRVAQQPVLFLLLTFGLGILGGLLYILPVFREIPGIKNTGVFHNAMTRGFFSAKPVAWLGILTGIFLIGFYILLYWAPHYLSASILIADPVSRLLSGNEASQWFLYGLLYTVVMLVMGTRMIAKYRHNRYQMIRTGSVIFFQTAFAFLIPEILVRLNQPYFDFKNIWPLNYTFFFDWNLNNLVQSGGLGIFMLVWGIALTVVAVPVITYFYGKRWYCSWVCGCGGLAETLGDPYRQLSDKSLRAWKVERWMIHSVLVFAVVMTAMTLYTYFSGQEQVLFVSSGAVRSWYGFLIGSAFAGVVGTGFYPLMGNRVWCRFGCPLAAYLGLVQRFKSRFRITVNGGQCISCGNCSTYCEMGIDVRHYAQRGQDIVRASCVGCGVCAAVCPRGVLRLENAAQDVNTRAMEVRLEKMS